MENNLVNYIKDKTNTKLKNLEWDNIKEIYEEIRKYYNFLLRIKKAQEYNPDFSLTQSQLSGNFLEEVYDTKENVFIGQVKYLLSGAEMGFFKLFIPESILREEGIEEGDWVKASVKDRRNIQGIPKTRYYFERIDSGTVQNSSNRQMEEYLVVLRDDHGDFYIKFEKEGNPFKIYINDDNSGNFSLEEGDLVDYAYFNKDYLKGRIIWRHFIDMGKMKKSKKSSYYKKGDHAQRRISDEWENQKIAVIGFESNKNSFEEEVLSRGGIFRHFTGDERLESLSSQLIETDLIVVFIDSISHDGMFKIRAVAKNLEIPVEYSHHIGRSSFVRLVEDNL